MMYSEELELLEFFEKYGYNPLSSLTAQHDEYEAIMEKARAAK